MKRPELKYGLLGGLAIVLYFVLFYTADKALFLNPVVQWSSLLIYGATMFRTAAEDGAANGFNRDFRLRIRAPFVTFMLITLSYWLFYYGLHLSDAELLRMEASAQLEALREQISKGVGDPEQANKIREQILYLEKHGMSVTLGPILLQMAMGSIGGFGMAALITMIVKTRTEK